jgi:succinate-semialdehyde dehydrogenase/glutarate-semialdehyde dehydrogenase
LIRQSHSQEAAVPESLTKPEFLTKLFIGGEWCDAADGATFAVENPATGETLVEIADGGYADTVRAIDRAAAVQAEWGSTPAIERSDIIRAAARLFTEQVDHLANVLTLEQGKPIDQARGEIIYGAGFLDWFAEEGRRAYGMTIPASVRSRRITVLKQPAGVTAAITPWNFPAIQILRKLGAALAAGCTMVIKPAELTPLSALEIGRIFDEAGLPAGVLSVVAGLNPAPIGQAIMDDPRVRVVSFTGSTDVGKLLMRQSADTMKRVSLELGGQAPVLVFADADLDLAVSQTVASKTRNMGQTCVSVNRIYVERPVLEEFTSRLIAELSAMRVGDGLDPETGIGPLIEQAGLDKVARHVDDAIAKGATVALGGPPNGGVPSTGYFYPPTVLTGANSTMLVAQEETFGPVAPVFAFDTEEEALAQANATEYGLSAYVFTQDINRIVRITEGLEFGTVGVNDTMFSAVQAPFGGMKSSGIGREGGALGLDEFLEHKFVSLGGVG